MRTLIVFLLCISSASAQIVVSGGGRSVVVSGHGRQATHDEHPQPSTPRKPAARLAPAEPEFVQPFDELPEPKAEPVKLVAVTRTRRVQTGTQQVRVQRCVNGRCYFTWESRPVYRTETYTEWVKPSEKATQPAVSYRSQWPPVWSVNGNRNPSRSYLLSHLRSNANHRGKFWQSWPLESWTREQLAALHDDDHVGRVRRAE